MYGEFVGCHIRDAAKQYSGLHTSRSLSYVSLFVAFLEMRKEEGKKAGRHAAAEKHGRGVHHLPACEPLRSCSVAWSHHAWLCLGGFSASRRFELLRPSSLPPGFVGPTTRLPPFITSPTSSLIGQGLFDRAKLRVPTLRLPHCRITLFRIPESERGQPSNIARSSSTR